MSAASVAHRAAALARDASEEEAVANLSAGYQTMVRTAALAAEEGDDVDAAYFRRAARRYHAGLRSIARGADPIDVYERVTGSRPWEGR